ncbi:MAG TPA: AI-2E family transporter [Ohtaekwangia sp.]
MTTSKSYPFYVKSTVILFGLVLLTCIFFYLSDILIPLAFALMLAILLNPMSVRLEKWKIPRVLSIAISLLAAFIILGAIGYFLFSQLSNFTDELPVFQKKVHELLGQVKEWLNSRLGMDVKKQNEFVNDFQTSARPLVGRTVGTVLGMFAMIFLIPVYTFLFMFYKTLLLNFFYESFDDYHSKEVGVVLHQMKGAVQSFMLGLLLEALVVAILNSIALLLLGVKYAILLGVLGALLNVLPYIGGIIAISLPVLIATVTKDGFNTQLGIIAAYLVIQFIDNNFLVPYLVSSKVKINALVSIVVVLLGGALWGIPGMFLSILFIGVLKIVFDRVPELTSWGKLLGDEVPTENRFVRKKSVVANR